VRILWALLHRHASVPCALPHGHGCWKMGGDTGRCSSHLYKDRLDSITRRHRAPVPQSLFCIVFIQLLQFLLVTPAYPSPSPPPSSSSPHTQLRFDIATN